MGETWGCCSTTREGSGAEEIRKRGETRLINWLLVYNPRQGAETSREDKTTVIFLRELIYGELQTLMHFAPPGGESENLSIFSLL